MLLRVLQEEVPDCLCDVIEQSAVIRNVTVYLDDFTGFTPIQYRLMTRILQLAPKVVMTLNVDAAANPYQVSSVEHLFYLPKDTIFQLERICRENLISRDKDILLQESQNGRFRNSEELASLEKNLFREKVVPWENVPENIRALYDELWTSILSA